jgi:hypothetical protein
MKDNCMSIYKNIPVDIISLHKIVNNPLFPTLRRLNLINEIILRDLLIKAEYSALRINMNYSAAICTLSLRYHLSEDGLNKILYRKKEYKSVPIVFL